MTESVVPCQEAVRRAVPVNLAARAEKLALPFPTGMETFEGTLMIFGVSLSSATVVMAVAGRFSVTVQMATASGDRSPGEQARPASAAGSRYRRSRAIESGRQGARDSDRHIARGLRREADRHYGHDPARDGVEIQAGEEAGVNAARGAAGKRLTGRRRRRTGAHLKESHRQGGVSQTPLESCRGLPAAVVRTRFMVTLGPACRLPVEARGWSGRSRWSPGSQGSRSPVARA
jgi:hypothetical protein